ncbi:MAG: SapC family protein [Henriciella sp.]|uniref:SapC family protein n=1 Tax=Henriciella sp. TaxID=1968823 RepID=UPI003C7719BA
MTNTVLLNNVDHADLKVSTARGEALGDGVNQAVVVPTEFLELQREFPILVKKDQAGAWQAIALLGFDSGENLFLEGNRWTSRYMPAVMERGPFTIGMDRQADAAGGDPMINIDLDHPAVGNETGAPLFLKHGGNSPYLERIAGILRRLHAGLQIRKSFFDAMERLDLIEPVNIEGEFSEGMSFKIPGFSAISIDRLNELDADALHQLNRSGHLYAAHMMVASLNNIGRLIEMKARKVAAQSGGSSA